MVAPHAGAWIETSGLRKWHTLAIVAPHAGAWIETDVFRSHPSFDSVAPHAGAWIETVGNLVEGATGRSRLTQARGLKRILCGDGLARVLSRLTQARGLKLV